MKKPIKFICKNSKGKEFTKHEYSKKNVMDAAMGLMNGNVTLKLKCLRCGNEMSISEFKDSIDDSKIKNIVDKLINMGLKL